MGASLRLGQMVCGMQIVAISIHGKSDNQSRQQALGSELPLRKCIVGFWAVIPPEGPYGLLVTFPSYLGVRCRSFHER